MIILRARRVRATRKRRERLGGEGSRGLLLVAHENRLAISINKQSRFWLLHSGSRCLAEKPHFNAVCQDEALFFIVSWVKCNIVISL